MQPESPCSVPTHWWQKQVSGLLLCWKLQLGIFCGFFFFFSQLCCTLRFQNSPQTHWWEGFLVFGNFSSFMTPSLGWVSIPNSFVCLCFIFCPTSFQREWAAFLGAWCPPPAFRSCFVEVAWHSNIFWWISWGESGLPFLLLCHFRTAPSILSLNMLCTWLLSLKLCLSSSFCLFSAFVFAVFQFRSWLLCCFPADFLFL